MVGSIKFTFEGVILGLGCSGFVVGASRQLLSGRGYELVRFGRMHTWNTFHSRRFARPVVAVLAALSVMGGGLTVGAQAADTHQKTDAASSPKSTGGGVNPRPPMTV